MISNYLANIYVYTLNVQTIVSLFLKYFQYCLWETLKRPSVASEKGFLPAAVLN
jgi:hypothetical protein